MSKGGFKRHSKVVWPGFSHAPLPRHIAKIGRNDPCPCGSGQKYKSCHQKDGAAFLEKLGYARGYHYPHDSPGHHVAQQYLPDKLQGERFYDPSASGEEREIARRLEAWRRAAAEPPPKRR